MKKKKFPVFILCSLLTLTNIQTPWAFSDEALDDPVFSDESDAPAFRPPTRHSRPNAVCQAASRSRSESAACRNRPSGSDRGAG